MLQKIYGVLLAHQDRNFKFLFTKSIKSGGMVFYIFDFGFWSEAKCFDSQIRSRILTGSLPASPALQGGEASQITLEEMLTQH